jgi:hypothetical protein
MVDEIRMVECDDDVLKWVRDHGVASLSFEAKNKSFSFHFLQSTCLVRKLKRIKKGISEEVVPLSYS